MKNSAWYRKIWLKKLEELPVKESAEVSWTAMQQLLDQQMPLSPGQLQPLPQTFGTKLIHLLNYIIPAAAIVVGSYFMFFNQPEQPEKKTVNHPKKNKTEIRQLNQKTDTALLNSGIPILENSVGNLISDSKNKKNVSDHKPYPSTQTASEEFSNRLIGNEHDQPEHPFKIKNDLKDIPLTESYTIRSGNNYIIPQIKLEKMNFEQQRITAAALNDVLRTTVNNGIYTSESDLKTASTKKDKRSEKAKRNKKEKKQAERPAVRDVKQIQTPKYNYTLEAGISRGKQTGFQIGALGAYRLHTRWVLHSGIRLNSPRRFSGSYTHASYFRPDSLPAFQFSDSRKLLVADIPLLLEYKLSEAFSLKAGPLLSIPLSQSDFQLGAISKVTDTLMQGKNFLQQLQDTKVKAFNIGFSIGTSLHIRQFDINARYEWLSPYTFSNNFGSFRHRQNTFQIGLGYRFK